MKSALVLYPHQLYPVERLPQVDTIYMVEEPLYFGVDNEYSLQLHKQKLILHRASMRRYVEEVLWPVHFQVEYVELDPLMQTGDIFDRTSKYDEVFVFDPVDDTLTKRLLLARRERSNKPTLTFLPSPNFYLSDQDAREFMAHKQGATFTDFYKWQRERFNILIDETYKPTGGRWSFDDLTKQKLPEGQTLPSFAVYGDNQHVHDAIKWVNEHFPDNPGETDFVWPTNHSEAANWLLDFLESRLPLFGSYQEAVTKNALWLYHSALSPSLNIGLLSPQQVIEAALARDQKEPVGLPSLESFVRQILGWREFVRVNYITRGSSMRASNVFRQNRRLTTHWYEGNTGIVPLDDLIEKVKSHAYVHHTERLMIAGNLMLLCEIHPNEVSRWFREMFIDSYDWTVVPNIYSVSQFADGGSMTDSPRVSASNYILQMSDYKRGEWADVWDGLFWRFIERHKEIIKKNSRMRTMVQRLERLDPDRRRIIGYRAEDFLANFTRQ